MRTELSLERWACRCRAGPEMLILHMTREISAEKIYPQCTAINDGYSAAQALAANIFDWGAKATVQLYHNGTILEIYRCGIFSAIGFDSLKAEVAVAALCRRSSGAASFAYAVHGLRSDRAQKTQICLA